LTRVWISQCLCPARHCIMATAGEAATYLQARREVEDPLREKLTTAMREDGVINPWCGICKADVATWIYETRRLRFRTMDEAIPELRKLEAEQRIAAAVLGDGA
jgi:hypothetical protein